MLPTVGEFSLPGSGGKTLAPDREAPDREAPDPTTPDPQGARVSEIRLSVPARADYVHVRRSVIARVAAKLDFSYADIEDLRLPGDEACGYLLGLRDPPTSLTLAIPPSGRAVDLLAPVDGADVAE